MGVDAAGALAGRREGGLLGLPSVGRMAGVLVVRCREGSWVRTLVAALERFRVLTGVDLEALLARARADAAAAGAGGAAGAAAGPGGAAAGAGGAGGVAAGPGAAGAGVAAAALDAFARALDGHPDAAVAGLAMGPKVWFRLNGVPVAWRPLPASATARRLPEQAIPDPGERVLLLAPVGSGLHVSELVRLRVGDLGSLDEDGGLIPDVEAEPLAVRYQQRLRGTSIDRITFLSFPARQAVLDHLDQRHRDGLEIGPEAPLVSGPDGRPASRATVARARRRANAIIRTGSRLNVELCRTTGEFFREWGLPGSKFIPTPAPTDAVTKGGERA
jgi:ribosomal protein L12E/L44/L45/RPP1/RPP2